MLVIESKDGRWTRKGDNVLSMARTKPWPQNSFKLKQRVFYSILSRLRRPDDSARGESSLQVDVEETSGAITSFVVRQFAQVTSYPSSLPKAKNLALL